MLNKPICKDMLGTPLKKGDTVTYTNKGAKGLYTGEILSIIEDTRFTWLLELPDAQYRTPRQVCYITTM